MNIDFLDPSFFGDIKNKTYINIEKKIFNSYMCFQCNDGLKFYYISNITFIESKNNIGLLCDGFYKDKNKKSISYHWDKNVRMEFDLDEFEKQLGTNYKIISKEEYESSIITYLNEILDDFHIS